MSSLSFNFPIRALVATTNFRCSASVRAKPNANRFVEVNAPRPVIAGRPAVLIRRFVWAAARDQSDGPGVLRIPEGSRIDRINRPREMSIRENSAAASSPRLVVKRSRGRVSPEPEETSVAHLLPFSVRSADGRPVPAPVDAYFRPYRRPVAAAADDGGPDALWRATFRGKPMTGLKVSTPDGYTGVLCSAEERDGGTDLVADADRGQVIKDVVYWNWDKVPTDEDPLLAALRWTRLSEAMMSDDQ